MKIQIRILALVLGALMLLPFVFSCNRQTNNEKEVPPDPTVTIAKDGKTDYVIVKKATGSDIYNKALESLVLAIHDSFGVDIPCVDEVTQSAKDDKGQPPFYDSKDAKVIFFGDIKTTHPAVAYAKSNLNSEGFSVICKENALALYAENDICIRDLSDFFSQKYVKNMQGNLFEIDRNIYLSRTFKAFTNEDGESYDFTLPVLSVDTENSRPVTSVSEYVNAAVSVANTYSEYALELESARIRGRGNGTWDTQNSNKLPYKLKFDEKINLLGAGKGSAREWVLLSNPIDATQLRNTVAFALTAQVFTNIKYGTGFTYANVFLNGEYKGVYLICEQAEISSSRIEVEENSGETELSEYFIELDYYATKFPNENVKGIDYFKVADKRFVIKSDYNSAERCAYVQSKFEDLMDAIERGDEGAVRAMIDMPSCVDMYLLHEYTKNTDVGWSSFYMVLHSDGVLEFVWPWDFDLSSGNDNRIDNGSYEGLHAGDYETLETQSNPIFYNLMRHDFFKKEVANRWFEINELANACLFDTASYYSERYIFDFSCDACFNYGSNVGRPDLHKVPDSATRAYLSRVESMCKWFEGRKLWLDDFFADCLDA